MVHIAKTSTGEEILSCNLDIKEKLQKNIKYLCIDPECKTTLIFVNKYKKKNNDVVNAHFRHVDTNDTNDFNDCNVCNVLKFYKDPNNKILNCDFYNKWINWCKNTCDVIKFKNGFCIDIQKNTNLYTVRYHHLNSIKSIRDNHINNVILSGKTRNNIICNKFNKYFVGFITKNDIMLYNGTIINVYIDNGTDKIIKMNKSPTNEYIMNNDYFQITLIDMCNFMKLFDVDIKSLDVNMFNLESTTINIYRHSMSQTHPIVILCVIIRYK